MSKIKNLNTVKVKYDDEKLMERADKHFALVNHIPKDNEKREYSGMFVVIDNDSDERIAEKLEDLKEDIEQ
jgi:hypothetical protein